MKPNVGVAVRLIQVVNPFVINEPFTLKPMRMLYMRC